MAYKSIPGGSSFGLCRKMLRSMFTELYAADIAGSSLDLSGTLDVTGDVTLDAGLTVTGAVVNVANLPTSDPAVAGQLWANSGAVTVSAG